MSALQQFSTLRLTPPLVSISACQLSVIARSRMRDSQSVNTTAYRFEYQVFAGN
jgi:hypothetical protein